MACYTLLLFYYQPLGLHFGHDTGGFELHVIGMWLTFVLSTGLIAWFVSRMSASIRDRDHLLAQAREERLRNEQIVALGALAAGAAHELGTPLATMAVLARELEEAYRHDQALTQDLSLLRQQVKLCKQIITRMLARAGWNRAEGGNRQAFDQFMHDTLEEWRRLRPRTTLICRFAGTQPAPEILAEYTLRQALLSLLNNAADACPDDVTVETQWNAEEASILIKDRGPGVRPQDARLGDPFYTTKSDGHHGLGLFLAKATLERLGGRIRLFNLDGGGACTAVTLPLRALQP